MTEKFDNFFDVYDRLVPSWFMDVFAGVILVSVVSWIVSLFV
jgi:hypothetical protein